VGQLKVPLTIYQGHLLFSLEPMNTKMWMKICLAQIMAIETNYDKSIQPQTNKVEK